MNATLLRTVLSFLIFTGLTPFAQAVESSPSAPDRRITITIDDLPWVVGSDQSWDDKNSASARSIQQHHKKLMNAIKKAKT
ncbi:MAG: hypothetical protein ABI644_08855, partial [Arenimonas sp.]